MLKAFKLRFAYKRAFAFHFFKRNKRRAVGTHNARNIGTHNVSAYLLLKRTEHGIVEESTALHNNMLTEFVRICRTDNFIQCVFDNAD